MSITRLQQARQMYAMGQRVRFRGGGMDMGNESNQAQSASMGNSTSSNSSNDNSNDGPRGPQELGTSTRTVDRITAPEAYEMIGGKKFDVTPDTRDDRKRARVKQSILDAPIPNITDKGISFFKDGNLLTNSFMPGNNPLSKPKFNMGNLLLNVGMFAINPALYGKYRQAKSLYTGAKYATNLLSDITGKNVSKPFDVVEDLTKNISLKDKNVIESFKDSLTSNLTSKPKRKPVINTNTSNDGDGINSLENANALQDEYTMLLQKLQTGNITDTERTRYTMLKNMLGI